MTNREKLAAYKLEIAPLPEEDGGGYQALYPQLARTTVGYGETPAEALNDLSAGLDLLLHSLDEAGESLPVPSVRPTWSDFSGRVTLRLSKSLHFRLDRLADSEGVSLNALLSDILQSGATALESGHAHGAIGHSPEVSSVVLQELAKMRSMIERLNVRPAPVSARVLEAVKHKR